MLHDIAGSELYAHLERGFDRERDPYGLTWQRTARQMLEGGKILFKSGRLRRGTTFNATAKAVRFVNRTPYGATHQQPGKAPPGGLTINAKSGGRLKFRIGKRWFSAKTVRIPQRRFMYERGLPLAAPVAKNITVKIGSAIRRRFEGAR